MASRKVKQESKLFTDNNARNRVFAFHQSLKKPIYTKVEEAISTIIATGKEGASFSAIMNWILVNYGAPDESRLKVLVKKAIVKGINNGTVLRALSSTKAVGSKGSFTLTELPKKADKVESEAPQSRKDGIERKKRAKEAAAYIRREKVSIKS